MASIIERDGRWRVQVRIKGARPLCKTFADEQSAKRWGEQEEQRIATLKAGLLPDKNKPTPYQVAGVYMLYRGLELQYVGRSVHIYRRLNDHDRNHLDWDSYRIIPCRDAVECQVLEQRLIDKHRPPMNMQTPRKQRA